MLPRVQLSTQRGEKIRIVVSAPARLHLGLLNPFGAAPGRKYVSLGLAVRDPRTVVEASLSGEVSIPEDVRRDVEEVLLRLEALFDIPAREARIRVRQHAPRHVGLGSTTQLRLAVATAVLRLFGKSVDTVELARLLGRGEVSGAGTYVFAYGGLVLDSGKRRLDDFPRLLLRLPFPEQWVVVVVIPPGRGPSEVEEHKLFSQSVSSPELVYYAHFIVLNKLIPAVQDGDFEEFTSALEELQVTVGKMFTLVQGGIFSSQSGRFVEQLRRLGLRGVGQSSWGPTVYGFTQSRRHAESVCLELEKEGVKCIVTQADNHGAVTYTLPDQS